MLILDGSTLGMEKVITRADEQLIAACLYELIKVKGLSLADIISADFRKNKDAALLTVLKPLDIAKIVGETEDVFARKIATQIMMKSVEVQLSQENVFNPQYLFKAYTILLSFYMKNDINNAKKYITQYVNNSVFYPQLLSFVNTVMNFSIIDNRLDWVRLCLDCVAVHNIPPKSNWVSLAISLDKDAIFHE